MNSYTLPGPITKGKFFNKVKNSFCCIVTPLTENHRFKSFIFWQTMFPTRSVYHPELLLHFLLFPLRIKYGHDILKNCLDFWSFFAVFTVFSIVSFSFPVNYSFGQKKEISKYLENDPDLNTNNSLFNYCTVFQPVAGSMTNLLHTTI